MHILALTFPIVKVGIKIFYFFHIFSNGRFCCLPDFLSNLVDFLILPLTWQDLSQYESSGGFAAGALSEKAIFIVAGFFTDAGSLGSCRTT